MDLPQEVPTILSDRTAQVKHLALALQLRLPGRGFPGSPLGSFRPFGGRWLEAAADRRFPPHAAVIHEVTFDSGSNCLREDSSTERPNLARITAFLMRRSRSVYDFRDALCYRCRDLKHAPESSFASSSVCFVWSIYSPYAVGRVVSAVAAANGLHAVFV